MPVLPTVVATRYVTPLREGGSLPGIVEADDATKAKAAKTAMIFSRTNTLLSIPMLYAMVNFS